MRNRRTITCVAGLVAMLCLAGAAAAGKQTSSLSLVVLSSETALAAAATTPEPSHGGDVTFKVSTTQSERPFVNVRCYQDDAFVYDGWHGFFDGYYTEPVFTLASSNWTSGAATCTARLVDWGKSGRDRTLATMSFNVAG